MGKEMSEAIKEGLRVFLMAVIPLGIIQLQDGVFMWKPLLIAGLIALLRFVDKFLHNMSSEDGWLKKQGLTGF